MDPAPTETEMREATEWCTKFVLNSGDLPYPINAFAAALAKCRVDADKIRDDERERCAKIALITRIKLIGLDNLNSVALAKKNVQAMREAIAAAIRGGAE